MHPLYFLATLTVIAICPVHAATPGDSVPTVEAFATREQKVQSGSHAESKNPDQGIDLQVYHLDGIEQFESELSKELPTDFKQAKQIALQEYSQYKYPFPNFPRYPRVVSQASTGPLGNDGVYPGLPSAGEGVFLTDSQGCLE